MNVNFDDIPQHFAGLVVVTIVVCAQFYAEKLGIFLKMSHAMASSHYPFLVDKSPTAAEATLPVKHTFAAQFHLPWPGVGHGLRATENLLLLAWRNRCVAAVL